MRDDEFRAGKGSWGLTISKGANTAGDVLVHHLPLIDDPRYLDCLLVVSISLPC